LAPSHPGGAISLPPLAGHDEIHIPSAAFGTAQQPRPIDNGHPSAVMRDLGSDVGLGSVVTALAPGDDPNLGRERLA
jgi:hypothetical protein